MRPSRSRTLVAVLVAATTLATLSTVATAQEAGLPLAPADGVREATIHRTSYGWPHIVADDLESLAFGHGYAMAQDNACILADTLLTVRGERSKYLGPDERYTDQVTLNATNLEADVLFTDIRDRGVVEELLADPERGPGSETRALVRGMVAGFNRYFDDVGGAAGVTDPACAGAPWVQNATELDLWHGIYAANLLASAGVFVPQIVNAAPPSPDDPDPGLPIATTAAGFQAPPEVLPSAEQLQRALGRQTPFGSNGTAVGGDFSANGMGMVLGNPHFPWRGRYRFTQAHLMIPGKFNVAGGMLIGAPVVNIGWNEDVAWTHTVSTAYRFTPYEYRTLGEPTLYLTGSGPQQLERREVTVEVRNDDGSIGEVTEDLYRTAEGYVLEDPSILMGWTPASFWAIREANAEHLRTLDVFHEFGKATNVQELLDAHTRTGGLPWTNTMAADRHGDALYADHSVVPHVTDALVTQCATPIGQILFALANLPGLDGSRADVDCAWGSDDDAAFDGIFGAGNLPHTIRRDWVINANDSYWLPNPAEPLEGFARIIGCEQCERTVRTRMVYTYPLDRTAGTDDLGGEAGVVTHEQLRAFEHSNRVFAAELARENGDLQTICQAADGGEACDVLAAWDGRTDTDSVGAHIFREFWSRAPIVWEEPFDAARPVETPRNVDETDQATIDAMAAAIAALEEDGIALDATLGDLQVAGDDGASAIPIGGGEGATGNANVVVVQDPASNTDLPYPVTYGSSHIQAVAFTDEGPDARTILTYGIASDPTRPYHQDQTQLFSQEGWVDVPWTLAEIEADPNHTVMVLSEAATAPGASGGTVAPAPDDDGAPLPATGGGVAVLAGVALAGAAALRRTRRT